MTTDISLVAQVAVFGNGRAFDELVRRYQSPVRRFFLSQTLGDSQLSDDLAQDTFIKSSRLTPTSAPSTVFPRSRRG